MIEFLSAYSDITREWYVHDGTKYHWFPNYDECVYHARAMCRTSRDSGKSCRLTIKNKSGVVTGTHVYCR